LSPRWPGWFNFGGFGAGRWPTANGLKVGPDAGIDLKMKRLLMATKFGLARLKAEWLEKTNTTGRQLWP
jgi:hypothetical protein